jgi:hypothetical protein
MFTIDLRLSLAASQVLWGSREAGVAESANYVEISGEKPSEGVPHMKSRSLNG